MAARFETRIPVSPQGVFILDRKTQTRAAAGKHTLVMPFGGARAWYQTELAGVVIRFLLRRFRRFLGVVRFGMAGLP